MPTVCGAGPKLQHRRIGAAIHAARMPFIGKMARLPAILRPMNGLDEKRIYAGGTKGC
jgi:hypothetical protein